METLSKKQVVRICPYKHNPDNPFIELYFHFGMNNKTYLSPMSFGRPDPIVEFASKLKKSGDKEQWKQGKSLEPKLRTYVPVLIRGQESEGVKFWGFGKQVYQELLSIIADPDYGDITDPTKGRDIVVEFISAEESGASYPKTTIRVKPNTSPVTDNKDILKKLGEQKNIIDLFPELSYEELVKVMDAYLNPEKELEPTVSSEAEDPDLSPVVAAKTSEKTEKSEKADAKPSTTPASAVDVEKAFDQLFQS